MASEGFFSISVASVLEDVLKEHGKRLSDMDLASRKAEEAAARRYEAARWLRRTVGVVGAKDLPEEPSEEEFRLGLRSGLILCNALNKVQPAAVPKIVASSGDSVVIPDGAALSAYQYFENVRNFLVAVQDIGLPTFEVSDLEQGGKSSRIVNCILALKSYGEWRQMGGGGSWKLSGNVKPAVSGKAFTRKNFDPFSNSLARSQSLDAQESFCAEQNLNQIESSETSSPSLNVLVHAILSDKKPEEVPVLVESMLSKFMKEFGRRIASQNELVKTAMKGLQDDGKSFSKLKIPADPSSNISELKVCCLLYFIIFLLKPVIYTNLSVEGDFQLFIESLGMYALGCPVTYLIVCIFKWTNMFMNHDVLILLLKKEIEVIKCTRMKKENFHNNIKNEEASKEQLLKQYSILDRQQRDIQFLRHDLQTARAGMEFMQMKYLEELKIIGKHMHSLANAASGYHKVLAENRKLYNQVQDLKGSIRVYCRVRPFLPGQISSSTVGCIEDGNITIITPAKYGKEGQRTFTFNKVFGPSASQEEVFSDTQPLIRSVLDGYNVCIFAYGQTGSGKTYTMSGAKVLNTHNMGVNYRALSDLFNLAEKRRGTFSYEISVQMIEIYNEQVRDLICDGLNRKLEIRNGTQNGVNVPNANLVPVISTADVIELMNIGLRNRVVGATALNDRSSRSHCCLTVHVLGRDLMSGTILRGCMHLVDLAGSERVDKSEVTGERLKEAQHINKSLSALGDVIYALAQNYSHVPYRNSKLTQLLQDSLGGQAKTLMFVHISPEIDAIGETISTLKFAERVSTVELGAARLNKESGETKELKGQVASLKAALAKTEVESEHFQAIISTSDPSTLKTRAPSPAYLNKQHGGEFLSFQNENHRQPMEEVGNIEVRSNSTTSKKKPSLDLQDLLVAEDSHPWSDSSPLKASQNEDDKEISSGDWVDKVMMNKHESSLGHWDGNCATVPDFFYQRFVSDSTAYQGQQYCKNGQWRKDGNEFEIQRHRFDPVTTDDSDDLDVATSDSSEADALWQFNIPKATCTSNIGGPKIKKPQLKSVNSPDFRTPTHAYIPSSSRKISSGASRISRQTSSAGVDAKRISSSGGKLSSGK